MRLAIGALVVALLVWLWSRYNEDLEEEEFEEEIPLEFDVSEDDAGTTAPAVGTLSDATAPAAGAVVLPGSASLPEAALAPGAAAVVSTITMPDTGPATKATDAATDTEADLEPGSTGDAIAAHPLVGDVAAGAIMMTGGEEDDTTVPPRMAPPSQGAQEGYSPTEREAELEASPPGVGDNLEVIRGIGPKYAAQLAEMGITTFGALINTSLDGLTLAFPRVSEEELRSWIDQARELAESSP
jgi:predicted flap endonuclease-1-like 5' DNA nuclease